MAPKTAWSASSSLPSDRIPSRTVTPKPPQSQRKKGAQQQNNGLPMSPRVAELSRLVHALKYASSYGSHCSILNLISFLISFALIFFWTPRKRLGCGCAHQLSSQRAQSAFHQFGSPGHLDVHPLKTL
ncbi:hypothetical protein D9611_007997 [Ephemerocybe angulata]|uniref:Uncharacterized protein n=1 Tax=Ephemerocybe angulata TaxID=980116 RepID=A0A8H5C1H6_9AGAR|nr:hypothetical protein D9611_007997 [Tulosesus angulatus]